jgi:ABC-type transport system involved in cytochrome c biogenesis permease subunit
VLLQDYEDKDPQVFNQVLAKSPELIDKDLPSAATATGFEVFYNRFEPFHYASEFYVYALVLGLLSWLVWSKPLNRAAILLMVVGLGLSTFGLLARMYIQNRPLVNVTNLYSSAIFIGWGCAFFCLIIEYIFPKSIALVAGSAVAAITGIIAHNLSLSGDTMEMMQAVLDTNFWLATHVTCMTLGYTATFLAGFLGILYVVLGVFTTVLERGVSTMLAKMIYGVVCFATLLSFTGTVLGGIWADQSWGRFWGWDPKENGALLIVIWNALSLHARWGGMVKQRGMAQLAIAGNIVTSWSWFGTNMLGVGLHSYGFMPAALIWLLVFAASQLFLIGLGWIPQEYWMSFQQPKAPPPPENGQAPRQQLPRPALSTSS